MAYPAYHSALAHKGNVEDAPPLKRYERNGSIAFQHDIMADPGELLPVEFTDCDVFYLEPPWSKGFKVFNERVEDTAYAQLFFIIAIGVTYQMYAAVCICRSADKYEGDYDILAILAKVAVALGILMTIWSILSNLYIMPE